MLRFAAAAALALGAALLSACGSNRVQGLPPPEMREILPPPAMAGAPAPAQPPAEDTLPAVGGAGAATGPQVALTTAPDAPPPIAPPGQQATRPVPATPPAQQATRPVPATPPGAQGQSAAQDFSISLSQGDDQSGAQKQSGAQDFTLSLSDGSDAPATPAAVASAAGAADQAGWPRSFTATGVAFEVHEPRVESWDGKQLVAYAAVVAQPDGQAQRVPGVVRLTARTVVDKAAGTVELGDLVLTDASFPTAREREPAWLDLLRTFAPRAKRVSLANLEASAREASAIAQGRAAAPPQPTRLLVARNPALLVAIDGEPQFVPLAGTRLQGARNTTAVLLKDPAGKLYLRVYNGWLGASDLRGAWSIAQEPPGAAQALKLARASGRANLLTGKRDPKTGKLPALGKNNVPMIVVSLRPAILIGVSGEPKFAPIPGTKLEYVTNTKAHVFRDTTTKRIYALVAGRWFEAPALRPMFELTPAGKLPADFAKIPADSPKGQAVAAVKPAASGAVPTPPPALPAIVAAPRTQARFDVVISGDPKLQPIPGTELNYVANASAPIIQVDINNWYGEQSGVWFKAPEATGPWTVTDKVPPEIYSIPPNVPIYHAIHSRVFASTEDVVYYGYTPGSEHMGPTGGAAGVSVEGEDYQTTPPAGMMWGWFY
jgi:hypothetical protein